MSRVTGRIVEIFVEDGVTKARVNIGGRVTSVALTLVLNARVGDDVMIGSGIALAIPTAKVK